MKTNTPLVSVIIPVYNAEEYLRQCLDSIINQTLKNIEIICVDDGSTDTSLGILREYERLDSRIKVLTQKNLYAGVARNTGMDAASGKYYVFLDADDFFEPDLLETQFHQCEENNADIGLCAANLYNQTTKQFSNAPWLLDMSFVKEQPFSRRTLKNDLFKITRLSPWTKIFSAAFVKKFDLRFQAVPRANDVFFVMSALALAESIVAVDKILVHYRVGFSSNLQSNNQLSPTAFCDALVKCKKKLEYEGVFDDVALGFVNDAISQCLYTLKKLVDSPSSYQYLIHELKTHYLDELGISTSNRLYLNSNDFDALIEKVYRENDEVCVSVVIPVYNVEQYLDKCLDSVIKQTCKNIEIIAVNDASTDSSLSILQNYAAHDSRICIVDKTVNGGAVLARRDGVRKATGKYIMFLDADDYLDLSACQTAVDLIEKHRVDILQFSCGVEDYSNDADSAAWLRRALTPKGQSLSSDDILKEFFVTRSELTALVGKIYSTVLIKKAESCIDDFYCFVGEDICQFFYFAYFAKNYVGIRTNPLYWYRRGLGVSNADKMGLKKFTNYCEMSVICERIRNFLENYADLNRYQPYYKAMSIRMMEDCCKIFKNRIDKEDQKAAAKILLKHWSSNPVCGQVIEKCFAVSYDVFRKNYVPVPNYVKIAPAYASGEKRPKVTIIIPVYNTEEYLRECLDSVVNQSLNEVEIICVNDGSLDNSLSILEEYYEKDPRITLISKENGGQSIARNIAMKYASGEYIQFLDSDDLLAPNALANLYEIAKSKNLDVLFYSGDTFYDSKNLEHEFKSFANYYRISKEYGEPKTGPQLFAEMEERREYRVVVYLQFVKREHLLKNHLVFPSGIIHEDNLFTFQNLLMARSATRISASYYQRRIREGSIMTAKVHYSNFYGYLKCFAGMLSFCESLTINDTRIEQSIKNVLNSLLKSTIQTYAELSAEEQAQRRNLTPLEAFWFQLIQQYHDKPQPQVLFGGSSSKFDTEAAAIRASWSYRIGRFITFIPRKIRGGIRCYQEHGMRYTMNRVQEKFWNLFGK